MILDAHHDQVLPHNTDVYILTFWDGSNAKFRWIIQIFMFLPPDFGKELVITEAEVLIFRLQMLIRVNIYRILSFKFSFR